VGVHDLDPKTLGSYLATTIPGFGDLTAIEKFADGQSNPTYRLATTASEYVLRRKPPGKLLKSAHAVDREYRVLDALSKTDVPVPKVFHLCEDEDVIGSMFYVMEFVPGRVFWDPALPELDVAGRGEVYDQMNRVLAAIHTVDLDAAGLLDFGRPGNYYERQFSRWSQQYRASETDRIDEMEKLIDWFEKNMVADDGRVSLVHGDYRLDNIMFAHGTLDVAAVMDWELSTLGHPFADLAYQCMLWRWPGAQGIKGLGGVDLAALGIPDEEAYIDAYCQRTGTSEIENWPFYLSFGIFRLAAIAQGVQKRALDGNASSKEALRVGAIVKPLAQLGVAILDAG
jgi:aminoglycoside phosphotransferase (APT) family kinase protein